MLGHKFVTSALVFLSPWALTAVDHEIPEAAARRAVRPLPVLGIVPTPPVLGVRESTTAQDPAEIEAALGLHRAARRLIQQRLSQEGFDPGMPDGLFGPRTRAAIRDWQASRGVTATGYLTGAEAEFLRTATTSGLPTSASGDSPTASSAEPATVASVVADCKAWNTEAFFQVATATAVRHCLAAGADVAAPGYGEEHPATLGGFD